ncbi:MAG TPA: hypothetical protein VIC35_10975 [Acidimicrobiia bacterium]|jgi:acetyl-CoA C-acetyltransferase
MPVDPRAPVIVGVGQTQQRCEDATLADEPIALLARAARLAHDDSGARRSLLERADTIAVPDILSWQYPDPGATLAGLVGATPSTTVTTTVGGNSPQMLVNRLAAGIARGEHDIVVIGGAECVYTRWRARRAEPKVWLQWPEHEGPRCAEIWGDDRPGSSAYEMAHMALAPTQIYPLFESAIRCEAGASVEQHLARVGALWSSLSAVAAENPLAWSRTRYSPDEITTPTADNRLVTAPYTKRMCANIDVDQAAAFILCSYATATAHGVPDDRMVFPQSGADAHDHYFFTERETLTRSPAITATARAALDAAGAGVDDVARFDLYSCFPCAVEIALDALGLGGPGSGDERPVSVTGGLGFAGGPGNNYVTHSIAAMVDACRRDPGSLGLVTALGWYVTKHSVGLYSTTPPEAFTAVDPAAVQPAIDALPARVPAGAYEGEATLEASAVVMDRDGSPNLAILSSITPDGRRALANTRDPDTMTSMIAEAWEGRHVKLTTDGDLNSLAI